MFIYEEGKRASNKWREHDLNWTTLTVYKIYEFNFIQWMNSTNRSNNINNMNGSKNVTSSFACIRHIEWNFKKNEKNMRMMVIGYENMNDKNYDTHEKASKTLRVDGKNVGVDVGISI